MSLNITLADYGVGNLHSIKKSLENCGANVTVIDDMKLLKGAECIVFPGVGAFDKVMEMLIPYNKEIIKTIESGTPVLGICIGTQIMFDKSDEGKSKGIGLIEGSVKKLRARVIPHMGWNAVLTSDDIMENVKDPYFYFAHSYYGSPVSGNISVGSTEYEDTTIPTLFKKYNFYGSQFHPEKSSVSGMIFLRNFIRFAEGCL